MYVSMAGACLLRLIECECLHPRRHGPIAIKFSSVSSTQAPISHLHKRRYPNFSSNRSQIIPQALSARPSCVVYSSLASHSFNAR